MANSTVEVNPDLQYFYGKTCPHTAKVDTAIQKMEDSLKIKVQRLEVFQVAENKKLLTSNPEWAQKCGGVPFLYNQKTGATLCGSGVSAEDVERWATGANH